MRRMAGLMALLMGMATAAAAGPRVKETWVCTLTTHTKGMLPGYGYRDETGFRKITVENAWSSPDTAYFSLALVDSVRVSQKQQIGPLQVFDTTRLRFDTLKEAGGKRVSHYPYPSAGTYLDRIERRVEAVSLDGSIRELNMADSAYEVLSRVGSLRGPAYVRGILRYGGDGMCLYGDFALRQVSNTLGYTETWTILTHDGVPVNTDSLFGARA